MFRVKRLARFAINTFAFISLVSGVFFAVLWARSYFVDDMVARVTRQEIGESGFYTWTQILYMLERGTIVLLTEHGKAALPRSVVYGPSWVRATGGHLASAWREQLA